VPRPISVPSGILLHATVWPHNAIHQGLRQRDRTVQDRQRSDCTERTVLQTVAQICILVRFGSENLLVLSEYTYTEIKERYVHLDRDRCLFIYNLHLNLSYCSASGGFAPDSSWGSAPGLCWGVPSPVPDPARCTLRRGRFLVPWEIDCPVGVYERRKARY